MLGGLALLLSRCSNSPYAPGEAEASTLFLAISAPVNKLDPATSYYSHEAEVLDNVVEPLYEYHHLKRPYELQPLAAEEIAEPVYRDAEGRELAGDPPPEQVARAEYVIRIRPGMHYADHPCFAINSAGQPYYRGWGERELARWSSPAEFPAQATREVTAEDFVRGIRRLADPRVPCPIYATLRRAILGFDELQVALAAQLEEARRRRREAGGPADEQRHPILLDYLAVSCPGVEVIGRHAFRIVLKRKYPQIRYWMAMHFFAPVPREALEFYAEPAIAARQFDLNRWPVGAGPFYVRECQPERRIVLARNPRYRGATYPAEGAPGDREAGHLDDAGRRIPFLERAVITVEKETIPYWNKFWQGYYDIALVTPEVFEQTLQVGPAGDVALTERMRRRGIRLASSVGAAIYWFAFNMADPVIGGLDPDRARLRQALSVALDYEEFLDIFLNGQGLVAQGPIPPDIFGYEEGEGGVNAETDLWDAAAGRPRRRPIEEARRWMAEAGWPDGRGPDGRPLVLHFDHAAGGDPAFVSVFEWMRRRFRLLGVELRERGTELSRYRDKIERGAAQTFRQGWFADYPDPENFLFLFYGPNAKVRSGGANVCNYQNGEYDRLFERMEGMRDGPERKELIDRMVAMLRRDAPLCWGFHPKFHLLSHGWVQNAKPRGMSHNTLKYIRVDGPARARYQREWNRPVVAPVVVLVAAMALAASALGRRPPRAPADGGGEDT